MADPYRGVTYPMIFDREWVQKLWKRWMCPLEIHLFDEVWTPDRHYIICDACGLRTDVDWREGRRWQDSS